ncbi:MAG: HK97 family phage prohead protease [Sedimentisphaerales bacterium]
MFGTEVDFKAMVERIQTGERDYTARFNTKGTETYREFQSLFVKSIDEANRRIKAIVSDASLDRYDEVILPEAFRETLATYLANPVVISSHQHRIDTGHSSVVGKTVSALITEDGLNVVIEFAETELGNEFWYLYKNKYQCAFSVGFIPLESKTDKIGDKSVVVFTKVELLEISCVAVPANRNALSKSKQRKHDFIADKIAQRKSQADVIDEDDANAFGLIGLSRKDFSEDELAEFSEDELAVLDLSGEADAEPEPDYGSIVKSGPSQAFYNE